MSALSAGENPGPLSGASEKSANESNQPHPPVYRGRVAPSPNGLLHRGHARTFRIAARRAIDAGGVLVYRDEDLDRARSKAEFSEAALVDLARLGIVWQEGPDLGGPFAPYRQSDRLRIYREYWRQLCAQGAIYPCEYSRAQIRAAIAESEAAQSDAPPAVDHALEEHGEGEGDSMFPARLRPEALQGSDYRARNPFRDRTEPGAINWRFRVPDGEDVAFRDLARGERLYRAGRDFGDFLVWRKDGWPSYEFAVVVDDHLMRITEVVRGADLLLSTARQLLIYRDFSWEVPQFYHCDLVRDDDGRRLAKRHGSLAIRTLLDAGKSIEFFD